MAHLALQKMSSQLTSLTTVFDGQNWQLWSQSMRAFLMSNGLWAFVNGDQQEPVAPSPPAGPPAAVAATASQAEKDACTAALTVYTSLKSQYDADLAAHPDLLKAWQKSNDMAIGNITLHLSPAIQTRLDPGKNAEDLWNWVKDTYGGASIPSVYCDLKEAISIRINPNQHPGAQFDKIQAAIQRLSAVSYTVGKITRNLALDPVVVGLIALAAVPAKWENLIPIICSSYELEDIVIGTIREQVVTQYENEVNHGGHKQSGKQANPANAHKLSAVKRKRSNPRFSQQERQQQPQAGPSNPNQQQSN